MIRFKKNIRLANSIINTAPNPRDAALDKEDLMQEAYLGLWKACTAFDESRGWAFSTFAVPTIKGQISRALRESSPIREPRSFKDLRNSLQKHGFSLPLSEQEIDVLLDEGKFSRKQILQFSCFDGVYSLDDAAFASSDGDAKLLSDYIPDPNAEAELEQLSEDDIEKLIDDVLKYVDISHKDMVEEWMYATLEGYHLTQMDLSKKYSVSQADVSRTLNHVVLLVKSHGDEVRDLFGI